MQQFVADHLTGPRTGMSTLLPSVRRPFEVFAWGVLAYNVAVILWGALVRATGSGAGCGGHWPLCNGDVLPQVAQAATIIEFTHRIMSGIALLAVATQFVWALKAFPPRHPARRWASWSLLFILTEALLGAALVLLGYVAKDTSTGRIYVLSAHLINTFLLLASLALTAWWASMGGALPAASAKHCFPVLSIAALGAVIIVAVAGAITALGDTLFPAHSLAEGMRDDFRSTASFLVRLRVIHPVLAIAAAVLLIWLALAGLRAGRTSRLHRLSMGLLALVVCQLLAGAANILLKAPLPMQLIHLLIADCLWITLVLFVTERAHRG